ncbi:MAG: hypothetical protein REI11_22235, partial [Patulibacter sp.]|nr:hypothetical protein [Patulibacter sp.]
RLADLHPPGEWRQRAIERIAELERAPVGEGVPVRDFEVRTVDGRPIYTYAADTKAGDVTGQGVGGVWYAVNPDGSEHR